MTWKKFWGDNAPPPPASDVAAWGVVAAIYFGLWWAFAAYGLLILAYVAVYGRTALKEKIARLKAHNERDKLARERIKRRARELGVPREGDDVKPEGNEGTGRAE